MIPVAVTFLILQWLFVKIDGITAPLLARLVENLLPGRRYIPGSGFIITVGIIYLMGLVATNVMGRRLISKGDEMLSRIPLVKSIYLATKQIITALSMSGKESFREVVLTEFPRQGIYAVGFITNETVDESGKEFSIVFIPTTPNPTSGFALVVPRGEVIRTTLTIEEGLKYVVSGGIIFNSILYTGPDGLGNSARHGESVGT